MIRRHEKSLVERIILQERQRSSAGLSIDVKPLMQSIAFGRPCILWGRTDYRVDARLLQAFDEPCRGLLAPSIGIKGQGDRVYLDGEPVEADGGASQSEYGGGWQTSGEQGEAVECSFNQDEASGK